MSNKYLYNSSYLPDFQEREKDKQKDNCSSMNVNIHQTIRKLFDYNKGLNDGLDQIQVKAICYHAREVIHYQSTLLQLHSPVKIIGNIHGQFSDLLKIFDYTGQPGDVNYIFLGDYVDRGKESVATIALLLCYKIKYPQSVFLLRGNHESAFITRIYGFYDQCKRRYNLKIWKMFCDLFNIFPYAAIIEQKIFCIHGGLSPELERVEKIKKIERPIDIPKQGLISDMVWSDPDYDVSSFEESARGVGQAFGEDAVYRFLKENNLQLIVRSHQVVEDGYEFMFKKKVVTIFSAPNFQNKFDNSAAVMTVDDNLTCSFQVYKPKKLQSRHKLPF